MAKKPLVSFEGVSRAIRNAVFPSDAAAVIGILRGGQVPSALVAYQLNLPLFTMRIRFRDDLNHPMSGAPEVISHVPDLGIGAGCILLVDDVSVTGATFEEARRHLGYCRIMTVALKGRADILLMPELSGGCVRWPWNEYESHGE